LGDTRAAGFGHPGFTLSAFARSGVPGVLRLAES
jgi:hypothetical protein